MNESSAPLKLNLERYRQLTASRGWFTVEEQAKGLKLSQATASRLRAGIQTPGAVVVAALLREFPDEKLSDLFVVDDHARRTA